MQYNVSFQNINQSNCRNTRDVIEVVYELFMVSGTVLSSIIYFSNATIKGRGELIQHVAPTSSNMVELTRLEAIIMIVLMKVTMLAYLI